MILLDVPFVFSACKKDEISIIGMWNTTKIVVTYKDGRTEDIDDPIINDWFINLRFNGTFSLYLFEDNDRVVNGTYVYDYNGRLLLLMVESYSYSATLLSLTETQMVLDYGNLEGDDIATIVIYYTKAQ
jgi:hypothetical protein